ncbi:hypothetical protein [Gordonia shandongensis]|uniref:hypothetical protein n=1 Tax=Gordonia shandongensis TaxID=376351 RepID=UPI0004109B92|nr:hypothetical protein [Gordonia shandongensis]
MASRVVRLTSVLAAAAATTAVLAGCGDGSEPAGEGPSGRAAVDLVLDDGALPSGYAVATLGKDQMQQILDQMVDSTKGVEVDPERCRLDGSVPEKADTADAGLMVATGHGLAVSESVEVAADTADGGDLDAARAIVTDPRCETVTVKVAAGPIKDSRVSMTTTVLDVPRGEAAAVLAVKRVTRTENGARTGERTVLSGRAVVKGYAVTVEMSPLDGEAGAADVDEDAFAAVLAAAISEVAARA